MFFPMLRNLKTDPVKKVHLISPEEFLLSPRANSRITDEPQEISEIGVILQSLITLRFT